jgi:hypothetical protein
VNESESTLRTPSETSREPEANDPSSAVDFFADGQRNVLVHGRVVRLMIWVTVLLTLAMLAIIYYRWVQVVLPTSWILPQGDESVEGAAVVVKDDRDHKIAEVTLKKDENYIAPVFLDAGIYTVITRLNGKVIDQQRVMVPHRRGVPIHISLGPATRPVEGG